MSVGPSTFFGEDDNLDESIDVTSASETIQWELADARMRLRSTVRRALIVVSCRRSIGATQLEAIAHACREVGTLELLARCAAELSRRSM